MIQIAKETIYETKEIAKLLKITPHCVCGLCHKGEIKGKIFNGKWMVLEKNLLKAFEPK